MKISICFSLALVAMGLIAVESAQAACTPSATHYCVQHNPPGGYLLRNDPSAAFATPTVLHLVAGVTYTFEADDGSLISHPFYFSSSSTGGGPGALSASLTTGSITFTPTSGQMAAGLYYQCAIHVNEGRLIQPCASGTYNSSGTCVSCTPVADCVSALTCTTDSDSQCTACSAGYYVSGGACAACTAVANCASGLTCTNASNSQCATCSAGYYESGGACPACTAIPGCAGGLTCTDANDSSCATCAVPDDLNCYAVKDLKSPEFQKQTGVAVGDAYATTTADVSAPSLLCTPASVAGSTVTNPQARLCCYKAKEAKLADPPRVEATDEFGTVQLQLGKGTVVCRPCTTTPLP